MKWLDRIPTSVLVMLTIILGLAPFVPEPHVVEKLRMLLNGTLRKPIDIFDLVYHLVPLMLLITQLGRKYSKGKT